MRDADVEGARPESGPGGTGGGRIAAAESLLEEFTGLGRSVRFTRTAMAAR